MHTFGLAVDLNYKGNPFIGNAGTLAPAVIRRATGLVLGKTTEVTTTWVTRPRRSPRSRRRPTR